MDIIKIHKSLSTYNIINFSIKIKNLTEKSGSACAKLIMFTLNKHKKYETPKERYAHSILLPYSQCTVV